MVNGVITIRLSVISGKESKARIIQFTFLILQLIQYFIAPGSWPQGSIMKINKTSIGIIVMNLFVLPPLNIPNFYLFHFRCQCGTVSSLRRRVIGVTV